ncbi:rho GTPase-activating protein 11A [Bombina bombina]|uniref:rho GTPase-activating protein 11A n=1 Tax=Bombina bombina TaxID=8345 RepID=UPI00235AC046|nr:rho GTPase-activating protein 11A [Bombina bombina]
MKKQSPDYRNLARLAVVQHLRSSGIKIKHWNCRQRSEAERGASGDLGPGKVFGISLHSLPQSHLPDYGSIPTILVDICKHLEQHAHTEGLFRKSGSVVRLKLLKAKLDSGENCLSDSLPCDVAGILKQLFRELPEPVLHTDLQDAFFKAQQLASDEEKSSATILISCLMPDKAINILRYFFSFLHTVSMRSEKNKMDSCNLALIFAPNLLQTNEETEKISASTDKKLRIQAAVVRTLIDQAADIGYVPDFIQEKIPGMLGIDDDICFPGAEEDGEDTPGQKRRRRRSVGDFVSGALNKLKTNRTPFSTPQTDRTVLGSKMTPLILTPSTKRKLPVDSVQGISSKKRKSLKHNFAFELLPTGFFGSGSTPSSAQCDESPCFSLENSQCSFSPSMGSGNLLSGSGNLRRSKRYENRKVQRVDSGKTGCFSPKISRKERVRRSLRIRFSLGKSNKDLSVLSGFPSSSRSQNIGWRLANSQELNVTPDGKLNLSSPLAKSPSVSAGTKNISKSEDNLLTPKLTVESSYRMSWTGPRPLELERKCDEGTPVTDYCRSENCCSESLIVFGKPPVMPKDQKSFSGDNIQRNRENESLCEEEESKAQCTVLRIAQAFAESGSNLHMVAESKLSEVDALKSVSNTGADNQANSQVHFTDGKVQTDNTNKGLNKESLSQRKEEMALETCTLKSIPQEGLANCENVHQCTSSGDIFERLASNQMCAAQSGSNTFDNCELPSVSDSWPSEEAFSERHMSNLQPSPEVLILPKCNKECTSVSSSIELRSISSTTRRQSRVSDHINHFNKLSLNDCNSLQKTKSPIKLQRTPVRQSVRRINSLSGLKSQVTSTQIKSGTIIGPIVKSLSYNGSLSSDLLKHSSHKSISSNNEELSVSHESLADPKVCKQAFRRRGWSTSKTANSMKSVFEDLTNQELSGTSCKKPGFTTSAPDVGVLGRVSERERIRYKGSPRNPIARVVFLPSTKPVEL